MLINSLVASITPVLHYWHFMNLETVVYWLPLKRGIAQNSYTLRSYDYLNKYGYDPLIILGYGLLWMTAVWILFM